MSSISPLGQGGDRGHAVSTEERSPAVCIFWSVIAGATPIVPGHLCATIGVAPEMTLQNMQTAGDRSSVETACPLSHLWGKGEIEDMLFQPKNDHLLFAYFGVSLQVRRRSLRTDVRARLATKRKAQKVLERFAHGVLVRDAS